MPDENENLIPDKIDRAIVAILGIVETAFATAAAILVANDKLVPLWLALIVAIIPAVISYFAIRGPRNASD